MNNSLDEKLTTWFIIISARFNEIARVRCMNNAVHFKCRHKTKVLEIRKRNINSNIYSYGYILIIKI